jgi:surface antigen
VTVFTFFTGVAHADQYDDQMTALKQQAAAQQQQANSFSAEAADYQSRVNQLNAQIAVVQTQININQAQYDKVTANIADNEIKLAENKSALGSNIKQMYLNSNVTPLEMIASSRNISDYFDDQQYQDSIKDKIRSAMAEVLAIQQNLAAQKTQVTAILTQQNMQKTDLASKRYEANQLLATAAHNADAANQQVKDSNAKAATLRAQQAVAIAAASRKASYVPRSGGAGGACDIGQGNGGYPSVWCSAAQDSMVDSWGMYSRECVSYAAWSATERGHHVPYGLGNANQWPSGARANGVAVDGNPEVGNVAIYMGGYYGHAMIVEAVHGNTVTVSSMNGDNYGHYMVNDWNSSSLVYLHFH